MTSQGAGESFAPGEEIKGYQVCGLKGTCYIDVDEAYGFEEKLTNISAGDETVFRYIKSEKPWKGIEITCTGSGRVSVYLNDKEAGQAVISGRKRIMQTVSAPISMEPGEYELKLRFKEADDMELLAVTVLSD